MISFCDGQIMSVYFMKKLVFVHFYNKEMKKTTEEKMFAGVCGIIFKMYHPRANDNWKIYWGDTLLPIAQFTVFLTNVGGGRDF